MICDCCPIVSRFFNSGTNQADEVAHEHVISERSPLLQQEEYQRVIVPRTRPISAYTVKAVPPENSFSHLESPSGKVSQLARIANYDFHKIVQNDRGMEESHLLPVLFSQAEKGTFAAIPAVYLPLCAARHTEG